MYAQPLKSAFGDNAYFVAEGARLSRFRATEFSINGRAERFAAKSPDEIARKPDLVLVAVKNYDLPALEAVLPRICGPETAVVSVLNGIDSERVLESYVPGSTVLYCCVLAMDAVKEGNALSFTSRGRILLGNKDNGPSDTLDAVMDAFSRADLACERSADIHRSIWWKWMINIGVNQISAVTGANYRVFHTDERIRALMVDSMREVVMVARAEGVDLHEDDIVKWYPVLESLGPEGKTSMLQDMENVRKTEVESFSGRLIEMARARGLSVPVNETLYRIISVKERIALKA